MSALTGFFHFRVGATDRPTRPGRLWLTYEGWGYFFEQGYETSQALQARLATFLRGTAGWTVAVEQW